jgi:monothiol glutaredoxin
MLSRCKQRRRKIEINQTIRRLRGVEGHQMSENPVFDRIRQEVQASDVVLFMKGTPVFPQCGFSNAVVQVLTYLNVPFKGVNVLEDGEIREGIKQFSDWPTIPQLYVKGEFVGGCDIVREMFEQGELREYLAAKGIATEEAQA